jgi:arsenate reductase (thioredoxin)
LSIALSRRRLASASFIVVLAVAAWTEQGRAQSTLGAIDSDGRPAIAVLFLCTDGATESVVAAAYFQRIAADRGLNVRIDAVGMKPLVRIPASVMQHLKKNGYPPVTHPPRQATVRDLEVADVIVSIGVDVALLRPRGQLKKWNDVPNLTAHFDRSADAIRERVRDLVDELSRSHQGQ